MRRLFRTGRRRAETPAPRPAAAARPDGSADRAAGPDLSLVRRGALDLRRDSAQHRRYAALYDDLLS